MALIRCDKRLIKLLVAEVFSTNKCIQIKCCSQKDFSCRSVHLYNKYKKHSVSEWIEEFENE